MAAGFGFAIWSMPVLETAIYLWLYSKVVISTVLRSKLIMKWSGIQAHGPTQLRVLIF